MVNHKISIFSYTLSEGHELGSVGSTGTSSLVGNGSVSDGELSQVVANHLGLDLNLVEHLTVIDTNNGSNHLGEDHHVSEVGLDDSGLLIGLSGGLGLVELLHQTRGLGLESVHQSSSSTSMGELDKVLGGELHEVLEVNTSVGELLE